MSGGALQIKKVQLNWPDQVITDLKTMALGGYPNEVCGVIHEHGIIRQLPNTFCGDRAHGFDMELDIDDPSIRAIWHSHPNGLAEPSQDDLPCIKSLIAHGFNFPWIIVTHRLVTEWVGLIF